MDKLLLCTGNPGKVTELRAMLPGSMQLVGLADVGLPSDLPETGESFTTNALQKARFAFGRTGFACIADDSGPGGDGVGRRTGRVLRPLRGEEKNDRANMAKLLRELDGVEEPERTFSHRDGVDRCGR